MITFRYIFLFLLFFAIIFPAGYTTCKHYDFSHSVDAKSYLKMAQNDFNVTVTHKYRIIIPLMARGMVSTIDLVKPSNWNRKDASLWNYQLAFFLINTFFLALASFVLFLFLQSHQLSFVPCLIGTLLFCSSRWVVYASGIPYTDSLYYLTIFLFLYGIRLNHLLIIVFSLIIGPIAKESFFIFFPLIYFSTHFKKLILWAFLSVLVTYLLRFSIDTLYPVSPTNGVENALSTFQTIGFSLQRIFSYKGILELFLVFSWFNIVLMLLFIRDKNSILANLKIPGIWLYLFLLMIGAHMLLSGDIDRMFCFSAPFWALLISALIQRENERIFS